MAVVARLLNACRVDDGTVPAGGAFRAKVHADLHSRPECVHVSSDGAARADRIVGHFSLSFWKVERAFMPCQKPVPSVPGCAAERPASASALPRLGA